MPPIDTITRMFLLVNQLTIAGVMPRGTPLTVPASLVWLRSFSGWTKLRITRLTAGWPPFPLTSQAFFEANSVTVRSVAHVQASSLQCHAPKIWIGVGVGARPPPPPPPGFAATVTSRIAAAATMTRSPRDDPKRRPDIANPPPTSRSRSWVGRGDADRGTLESA